MKKTLYLMRHGETFFNQQKKIQGWCDSPLTEKGIKQAQIAGQYFDEQQITIESAYASTSERACDTLEYVTDLPYRRLKGLKEWNFGRFESESEALNPSLPYGDFFVPYGGEAEMQFRQRVSETILEMMRAEKNQTVLAVSHGASCRQFMRSWAHTSDVDQVGGLKNCSILKFDFEADTFTLKEIINHDYSTL